MAEADGKIRIKVDLDSADAEREMQGLSGKLSGQIGFLGIGSRNGEAFF